MVFSDLSNVLPHFLCLRFSSSSLVNAGVDIDVVRRRKERFNMRGYIRASQATESLDNYYLICLRREYSVSCPDFAVLKRRVSS